MSVADAGRGPAGAGGQFPLRVACVDTGSNAIRFLAAEFVDPNRFQVLQYRRAPVRLGHQVFLDGRLARSTMDDAVAAFGQFRVAMEALGIEHLRAVATSAVREARNGDFLVQRISRETGIRLETISGYEESRLVHAAVASRIDLAGGNFVLVDLGGGSVEVSLVDEVGMLWAQSHTMGSVRLLEELSGADDDPGRFRRLVQEYVSVLGLPSPAQYLQPRGMIATGGNIEALTELAARAPGPDGISRLPVDDLRASVKLLSRMSYGDKLEQLRLGPDRADVILPAAVVYLRIAELVGTEEILVPHVGVKEGVLLDLVDDLVSHRGHEDRQERQLQQSSIALGRRFLFDEAHGLKVAELATRLFDQLSDLHGMDRSDRHLILTAAILHDIGLFISHKRHHRHSLYIIKSSELPGLSRDQMSIVANVARYHRKSGPSQAHEDYAALPREARMKVTQLAAILRLADALDRQHRGYVTDVRVEVSGRDLQLSVAGGGDLLLERWAVARKCDVFEDTFGLRVVVDIVADATLEAATD